MVVKATAIVKMESVVEMVVKATAIVKMEVNWLHRYGGSRRSGYGISGRETDVTVLIKSDMAAFMIYVFDS